MPLESSSEIIIPQLTATSAVATCSAAQCLEAARSSCPVCQYASRFGRESVSDGHACLPRALAVRAINDDPAVSSDGGLAAQRTHRRCVARVETLVQQARALIMTGTHGHVFLKLCCASDAELAAAVVEHSGNPSYLF